MKIKKTVPFLIAAASCLFPLHSSLAAAKPEEMQKQIAALQKSLEALQKQQAQLQKEHTALKKRVATQSPTETEESSPSVSQVQIAENLPALGDPLKLPKGTPEANPHPEIEGTQTLYLGDTQTPEVDVAFKNEAAYPYGYRLLGNLGGTAVITSPFIQSRYDFRGANLIVNYSSINKDLAALRQRRNFLNHMTNMGLNAPNFPLLELSGAIEGTVFANRTYTGRETSSIEVTDSELDVQALVNPWFTGFMTFAFDNSPPAMSGTRLNNSRVFIDNAFITLGNLNKSPFYSTLGQIYVPFGQYDSYLINNPINKTLFRTRGRALTIDYATQDATGTTAQLFVMSGDTRVGKFYPNATERARAAHINVVGANWSYSYQLGGLSGLLGASVINNVADSLGSQAAGGQFFPGFGFSTATEVIQHRVPGADVRAEFFYEPYTFIAEYTSATRAFSPYDVTFNGDGARPSAYHLEGVYSFDLFDRPSSLAIGFDESFEALAWGVPKRHYGIALNSSIWRNTLATIEYRHDINYTESDYATGNFGPVFFRPGKISNGILGRFAVYF